MNKSIKVKGNQDNSELCSAVSTFQLYLAHKIKLQAFEIINEHYIEILVLPCKVLSSVTS